MPITIEHFSEDSGEDDCAAAAAAAAAGDDGAFPRRSSTEVFYRETLLVRFQSQASAP
jgi:hypothetical protein